MQIRTDLAVESREFAQGMQGIRCQTETHGTIEESFVSIDTEEAGRALEKAVGQYVTLSCAGIPRADPDERKALAKALSRALKRMLPETGDLLVIGLGNRHITADSLGSKALESLLITRHMRNITEEPLRGRLRGVCAAAPGVLGVTGMETAEVVHGIVDRVHPAAVIAIDALAARDSGRICTTIQITDTGIRPGSGVGNHRAGLTRETLGVPVIAIGVPMVVYAAVIARDAIELLLKDMEMDEQEHEQAVEALVSKVARQGMGELVVTPREVDEWVGKVAQIIADGLNMALQPQLTEEEIQWLSHDCP